MASDRPVTTTRIACAELEALLRAIFQRHGCSEVVAAALAENMAGAERDGALSHGIFRAAGNLGSLDSGCWRSAYRRLASNRNHARRSAWSI